MSAEHGLIGRQQEQLEINKALEAARDGRGRLLLLAGDVGMGKTRLAQEVLAASGLPVYQGAASEGGAVAFGPVIAVIHSFLKEQPLGLRDCGGLERHLAILLPELNLAAEVSDRATLGRAIHCAFESITRAGPAAVFLDDLQWADNATLELLPNLVGGLEAEPILILGAYRSDEIPRGHPLRRMRIDLRRGKRLRELVLEPLNPNGTAELVARVIGTKPSPRLAATLYDRTEGVPYFIEELAAGLAASGRLRPSSSGAELVGEQDVPIPDTVRDAVLLRLQGLPAPDRAALEVAAVAGVEFDLETVAQLAGGEEGLDAALQLGVIREDAPGRAVFRHALTREAVYTEIPWVRRRTLHRSMAALLEAAGAPPGLVAEHWLAGRELDRARIALMAAAEAYCAVHAYRDALLVARRALDLWPEEKDESRRLDVLEQLGKCAELCGEFAEAVRAWREVADARRHTGDLHRAAELERRLAAAHELQGAWDKALRSRQSAADGFAACGLPGDAAAERLAIAAHLNGTGSFEMALDLVSLALEEARQAGRQDLVARCLALQGAVHGKMGDTLTGLAAARSGLTHALEHNQVGSAAEAFQRLASIYEQAADYDGAREAYQSGYDYCNQNGVTGWAQVCWVCLSLVLRKTGDWSRAGQICRQVLRASDTLFLPRTVAAAELGLILAFQGRAARAKPLLVEAVAQAQRLENAAIELEAGWGLALVDELNGAYDSAVDRCQAVLDRWKSTEDLHYAVSPLRWGTTFLAGRGEGASVRACAEALAQIAASSANKEALAALACALGEIARLEGEHEQAALQFVQALEFLREVKVPLDRAETQWRAGVALISSGERQVGLERLIDAYRTARKLGAHPLAERVAREFVGLGENIEQRLGRRAARQLEGGGLTRRELEVVRLIGLGRTNREIGQELFLSPRTVDMHVRNLLTKLDSSSRGEAVRKAADLALLD
ncbi:MAG: AAA family ATPase [Anaerolineales bacterium]